jgi:hypothetical protein
VAGGNLVQCPFCGTEIPFGILICPNCGGEIAGQPAATQGEEEITAQTTGYEVERTVGGAPKDATRDELVGMWDVKRETFTGGPHQGPPIVPASGVPTVAGLPLTFKRWAGGALVIIVVVAVIGIMVFLFGGVHDGDGGGNGGGSDLAIRQNMTYGYYLYEPVGTYRCEVTVENNALDEQDLEGLEVEVAVLTSASVVAGFESEDLSGTLAAGGVRMVGVEIHTSLSDPGEVVTYRVRLLSDGGTKVMDEYSFTYAV